MERAIVGYHRDESGDWVAELDCHHGQHVRHDPPFMNRPWVETPAGRAAHVGATLDCVLCDRLEMPEHLEAYRATPEFTEASIPRGLRASHTTKKGVWGRIRVSAGTLKYVVEAPQRRIVEIGAHEHANIAPEMPHCVEPMGSVRFRVEFYTKPRDG